MSATTFFVSLLVGWSVLYVALPLWLIYRGRFLTAGLVQAVGALLPGIWHGLFWPNEAGNFGLLMIMLVPIPLGVIAMGVIVLTVRGCQWAFRGVRGP